MEQFINELRKRAVSAEAESETIRNPQGGMNFAIKANTLYEFIDAWEKSRFKEIPTLSGRIVYGIFRKAFNKREGYLLAEWNDSPVVVHECYEEIAQELGNLFNIPVEAI